MPDALWALVQAVLPPEPEKSKRGGRPRELDDRRALAGVLYRARTGCQWRAIPGSFGHWSAIYGRFRFWVDEGFFEELFRTCIRFYDEQVGVDCKWMSMDAFMTKAPKGGIMQVQIPPTADDAGPKSPC